MALTSLANEQEEPHTARQIQQQRYGIPGVPEQINDGEECSIDLGLEPARLHGWAVKDGVRWWCVGTSCPANEWCSQTPGNANKDEAENVIEDWGLVLVCHGCCRRSQ